MPHRGVRGGRVRGEGLRRLVRRPLPRRVQSGGIGHSGNGCCWGLAGSDGCGLSGSGRVPRGGWRC